jgi:hypothetical protein
MKASLRCLPNVRFWLCVDGPGVAVCELTVMPNATEGTSVKCKFDIK